MKKNEFLLELKERLVGLSEADVKQSLDYYTEMIDDRMEDGLSEDEAVKEVGTPAAIAEEILKEMPLTKLVKARVKPNRKMAAWEIVLLILGSPLWLALLLTLFAAVLSLYIALWSVVISLWAIEVAFGGAVLVGVIALPISLIQGNVWAGIALLGVGVFVAGLCIFGFYGCMQATKGACLLGKRLFRFMKTRFIRKEAVR